jgi:ubiquinone/menaquinone biosynthesis C-methylase UbiE
MKNIVWATPLYKFLRECNLSPLERIVLDCGAGGDDPPLQIFSEYYYETYGIEVDDRQLKAAKRFCRLDNVDLNILKGDMRQVLFRNESFSFVYSYNAIFFMTKKEIGRVLKPNGLCFVNFLSADDPNKRSFTKPFLGNVRFSHFRDDEPDKYFSNLEIIHKEKRTTKQKWKEKWIVTACIDYIAKKSTSRKKV